MEFAYNNKIHLATKVLLFKANYSQNPIIGFEGKEKRKYKAAEKFVEWIRKIQKETKAALKKAQEEMKKLADKKKEEEEEYKIRDLVLLSTKDLEWQIVGKRSEKLIEYFVGPCRVKGIVLSNTIELELSSCYDLVIGMEIKQGWMWDQKSGISKLLHSYMQTSRHKGGKSKNRELTKVNNRRIFNRNLERRNIFNIHLRELLLVQISKVCYYATSKFATDSSIWYNLY